MEEFELSINIRTITLYEKLSGFPFLDSFNLAKNIITFYYSVLAGHPENKFPFTLKEFKEAVLNNSERYKQLFEKIAKEVQLFNQNNKVPKEDNQVIKGKSEAVKPKLPFIKDYIPILVTDCRLDIHYILDEMSLDEIYTFIKYSNKVHEQRLEEERLWTYLIFVAQAGTKKVKKPADLIKFPWEDANKKKDAEEKLNNLDFQKLKDQWKDELAGIVTSEKDQ